MSERARIDLPIIVEGKYDKAAIAGIFDATVITTDGFGIFNSRERQALIRRLAVRGIILLTDPDGAGKQIRGFLNGIVPKDKIFNVYVPPVEGKERRKTSPSRAGFLGVEGVGRERLEKALSPFVSGGDRAEFSPQKAHEMITKVDFYLDGLSGGEGAVARRRILAEYFELPGDMTANALLSALNILTDRDGYRAAVRAVFSSLCDAADEESE